MKKCISFFVVSGLLASGLFANSNEELRSSIDSLSSDIGLTPENLSPENISKLKEDLYGDKGVAPINPGSLNDMLDKLSPSDKAAVLDAQKKASQNPLSAAQIMSCGAVLCLAGGMTSGECAQYVIPYFAIKFRKDPGKTARERAKYLKICPAGDANSGDQAAINQFADIVSRGNGVCDTGSFEGKFEAKITINRAYEMNARRFGNKPVRHVVTETKVIVGDLATFEGYENSYANDHTTYITSPNIKYSLPDRNAYDNGLRCYEDIGNSFDCSNGRDDGLGSDHLAFKGQSVKVEWINPIVVENLPSECKNLARSRITSAYAYLNKNDCSNKKYNSVASFMSSDDANCKNK